MSISFSCPSCDASLNVREELAGRRLRCAHCGSSYTVPELDELDMPESASESDTGDGKAIRRDNAGVAVFYRLFAVGCILVVVMTGATTAALFVAAAPIEPAEEFLVGGVRTTNGVIGPFDRLREPKRVLGKLHKVTLKKDQSYVIDQVSNQLDSYLILVDAKGRTVAEDDDGGGNLNARIIYRPSEEGEFRIIATSFLKKDTGPYTLTIREDDGKAVLVQRPMLQPQFQPPPFQPPMQPVVQRPKRLLPQPVVPIPVALVDGKLAIEDKLQAFDIFVYKQIERNFGKTYEVELRGDRTYRIDMISVELDSYLIVVDAAGTNVLSEDDDSGGNLNARISFSPPATGKFRIVCTSFTNQQLGRFELTIAEQPRGAGPGPNLQPPPFPPFPQPPPIPQPPVPPRRVDFRPPTTPAELIAGKCEIKSEIGAADKITKLGKHLGKAYEFDLTANRIYVITLELENAGKKLATTPRITVQSSNLRNPAVASRPVSGAKTSQLSFTPSATGRYVVIATSTIGQVTGPFTLRVVDETK